MSIQFFKKYVDLAGHGSNIVLEGTSKNKFKKFEIEGKTEQTHYEEKNLVNINEVTATSIDPVTLEQFTDYVIGKTYTFSSKINLGSTSTAARIRTQIAYNDETPTSYIGDYAIGTGIQLSKATFTITDNIREIKLQYQPNSTGITFYEFQLEEGTTPTTYEPYVRTEYQAQTQNTLNKLKM